MSSTFAVGSRTKRSGPKNKGCPNPLFEEWLEQWRDEAREKGHPTHFGYDRALKSLRQFPLPLKDGKEATQLLKYWGDKLGKMLDKRIEKYEEETGLKVNQGVSALDSLANQAHVPPPLPTAQGANSDGSSASGKSTSRRKKAPAAVLGGAGPGAGAPVAPAQKKKRATSAQEYVPQRGSGPYAILLTLLKASQHPSYPGYMSKADIQREAQVYSSKSLTQADPGTHYTAWSSTGSLINKNLLTKTGCPARYALTANGEALAERLEAVENGVAPTTTTRPSGSSATSSVSGVSSSVLSASPGSSYSPISSPSATWDSYTSPPPAKRRSPGTTTTTTSTCPATGGGRGGVSTLASPGAMAGQAAMRRFQATSCAPASSSTTTRSHGETTRAVSTACIALSDDEDKVSDGYDHDDTMVGGCADDRFLWEDHCIDIDSDGDVPLVTAAVPPQHQSLATGRTTSGGRGVQKSSSRSAGVSSVTSTSLSRTDSTGHGSMSTASSGNSSASPGNSSASASRSTAPHRTMAEVALNVDSGPEPLSSPALLFPAGTYDIVLLCDICERRDGYSGQILEELERNHVRFERRKLHVGDYVWIAQERTQPLPGQLRRPAPRELVLDYIIERKRMDDLASSIIGSKDRYREQKFRIAQSGLAHPIYLVEDYNNSSHLIGEDALFQALATTQVQDGYFVKQTSNARESAAYLTLMSRRLVQMYSKTSVASCTNDELERRRGADVGNEAAHSRLLQFSDFNEMAVKNKVMSVSELFARQLMQITGISAVRAASILELYPTPRLLVEAYDKAGSEAAKKSMLSNLTAGAAKRRFNSTPLYHMYGTGGASVS